MSRADDVAAGESREALYDEMARLTAALAAAQAETAGALTMLALANGERARALEDVARAVVHGFDAGVRFTGVTPYVWNDVRLAKQDAIEEFNATLSTVPTETKATHRCKTCGSLWRLNPALDPAKTGLPPGYPLHKETWSLVSPTCGKCCDNVPMGEQIEPIRAAQPRPGGVRCDRCGGAWKPYASYRGYADGREVVEKHADCGGTFRAAPGGEKKP